MLTEPCLRFGELQMTKTDFLRNNRGIDDDKDLPEDFLGALYDRIVKNEINMKEDYTVIQNKQPARTNRMLGLDAILNINVRKRDEEKTSETSDAIIRHMQDQFKTTGKPQ